MTVIEDSCSVNALLFMLLRWLKGGESIPQCSNDEDNHSDDENRSDDELVSSYESNDDVVGKDECGSPPSKRYRLGSSHSTQLEEVHNSRRTNILRHIRSHDHKNAIEAEGCRSLTAMQVELIGQKTKAVVRNVYWLAKKEVATLKYTSLNHLVLLQGCRDITHLSQGLSTQVII